MGDMIETIIHKSDRMRLGIMGGTFDPIHYGHLLAAEEARVAISLDRVIFVPSGSPPHKKYPGMASAEDRYGMTLLATNGNPSFDVTRLETDRKGSSYTVETLQRMKELYPGADLYMITGEDAALDLPLWRDPYKIVSLAKIVAVSRPGGYHDKIGELPDEIRESVLVLRTALLDISATDIRERLASGRSANYLLPDAVLAYIKKRGLYVKARNTGQRYKNNE
jgi:nicotinate-nucleotide adenylyltransferase